MGLSEPLVLLRGPPRGTGRSLKIRRTAMGYRVAVVGATGNVGREMLNILEEVEFPVDRIHAIASRKSINVEVGWKAGVIKCEDVEQFDFSSVDIVLMSVSGAFSKQWAEKIGK